MPGPASPTVTGLLGTKPNLAAPGKRPLSNISPTIATKDGELLMVTGTPGGRTKAESQFIKRHNLF